MEAKKSLSSISGDRSNWIAQYRQEIFERDRISGIEASRREGIQQGIQQGAAQQKAEDDKLLFAERERNAQKDEEVARQAAEIQRLLAENAKLKAKL